MKMKRALSWIVCLALFFPNLIAYASTKTEKEAGVTIISTTPEDGSMGITPMGTKMEVTFNMPMDANSLSKTTISSVPNAINAVVPDPKSPARCTIYFSALRSAFINWYAGAKLSNPCKGIAFCTRGSCASNVIILSTPIAVSS